MYAHMFYTMLVGVLCGGKVLHPYVLIYNCTVVVRNNSSRHLWWGGGLMHMCRVARVQLAESELVHVAIWAQGGSLCQGAINFSRPPSLVIVT